MFWRLERKDFMRNWARVTARGPANRVALEELVRSGRVPGLLAYAGERAIGWICIAPRGEFVRLQQSRALAPVDDQPVWSVVCFYIDRRHRRQGVGEALLEAAVRHAARHGARAVEAYPIKAGDTDPFTGFESMFRAAGFQVARQTGRRAIVRRRIEATPRPGRSSAPRRAAP
jgi:GNAT superfamily N-acetyltransferase